MDSQCLGCILDSKILRMWSKDISCFLHAYWTNFNNEQHFERVAFGTLLNRLKFKWGLPTYQLIFFELQKSDFDLSESRCCVGSGSHNFVKLIHWIALHSCLVVSWEKACEDDFKDICIFFPSTFEPTYLILWLNCPDGTGWVTQCNQMYLCFCFLFF